MELPDEWIGSSEYFAMRLKTGEIVIIDKQDWEFSFMVGGQAVPEDKITAVVERKKAPG